MRFFSCRLLAVSFARLVLLEAVFCIMAACSSCCIMDASDELNSQDGVESCCQRHGVAFAQRFLSFRQSLCLCGGPEHPHGIWYIVHHFLDVAEGEVPHKLVPYLWTILAPALRVKTNHTLESLLIAINCNDSFRHGLLIRKCLLSVLL